MKCFFILWCNTMRVLLLVLCLVPGIHSQVCPGNWVSSNELCYHFVYSPMLPYQQAAEACQKDGAILVTVEALQEHSFIANRLRTIQVQRQSWYTSGEKDLSYLTSRFIWTATNTEIPRDSPMWLSQAETLNDDVTKDMVAYKFDVDRGIFGLGVIGDRSQLRPYICEISRDEVYRINLQGRGFDYGVAYSDQNQIKRGPKFTVEAQDTVIVAGVDVPLVYLECVASGVPQPEYQWLRNSLQEVITTDLDPRYTITNGRLTIADPVEEKDAGVYQCRVSNSEGVIISAPAQVSFASLGQFSNVQTGKVEPEEYQGAVIECPKISYRASTAITYQWMKSDADMFAPGIGPTSTEFVRPDLNNHLFISGNGKLYFSEVTTNVDKGFYYCVATLSAINKNHNYVGASQPPIRTSKGIELSPRTSSGGNFDPRIQDSFIAVVPGSPIKGMNISLECFAYGTTPLMYQWEFPRWDYARYSLADSNRVLKINNVQLEDSGLYACRVMRSNGAATFHRKEYVFTVEAMPEMILPLQDQHLDIGTRQLTWRCEARSVPFPQYTWYKNGVLLTNSSNSDVTLFRNTLILRNLNKERDEGMYQCLANNTHGEVVSTAQLRILSVAPSFSKYPMSPTMMGAIGGNLTLPCRPEAAPFPEISWLQNGGAINPSTDIEARVRLMINGDLRIRDLTTGDQGMFECRAVNQFGEDVNRTTVTIQGNTVLYRTPVNSIVAVNKTAFFYCTASFNQHDRDLTYQWAFNGRVIDLTGHTHFRKGTAPDNEGGLYIISAQFDHQGRYTCIAKTQIDSANATAFLRVLGPPGAPAGLEAFTPNLAGVQSGSSRDMVLWWTDPLDSHGSPVNSYIVYGKTNYSSSWEVIVPYIAHPDTVIPGTIDGQRRQFLVTNLKPGVSYQFKIRAVNGYGVGEASNPTRFVVIPGDVPYKAPDNIGGGGGKVGTLRITWDPLLPEDAGWGIGYEVEWRKKPLDGQLPANIKWNKDTVTGNVGEYSSIVGETNFYIQYNVRVTPFNIFGPGPSGTNDTVYSAEAMPIGIPGKVYAEPFNESSLTVYWQPVPDSRETMKGKLKGYKIFYWLKDIESQEEDARQAIIYGNTDHGRIIGLQPDTWYTVSVIVFNAAGNSGKSEVAHQSTDRSAPSHYPVHVEVYPHESGTVKVMFRGVSTKIYEEPLLGYKIRFWRDTEDIRQAKDVDCMKSTSGVIYDIQSDHLYHLRVLGYSVGGDGKMSSPETLFSYTRGRVTQITVDPTTSEVKYVFHNAAPSLAGSLLLTLCLTVLTALGNQ